MDVPAEGGDDDMNVDNFDPRGGNSEDDAAFWKKAQKHFWKAKNANQIHR